MTVINRGTSNLPVNNFVHLPPSLYLHIGKTMEMIITVKMLNNAEKKQKQKLKLLEEWDVFFVIVCLSEELSRSLH